MSEQEKMQEKVRALLGLLTSEVKSMEFQLFRGLRLVTPEGEFFTLSMQGSAGHYCEPRTMLPKLTAYEEVEVALIPDERNENRRLKMGTLSTFGAGRKDFEKGDRLHGWLMPSDVGFTRLEDNEHDDVLGYVPVKDLVADLADFFQRGGRIEGDHKDTHAWLRSLGRDQLLSVTKLLPMNVASLHLAREKRERSN